MVLSVHQRHSRNRVLVVVMVLVSALDEFLLGFLKAERAHKALAITRDVDVGHVAGVVHAGFPLQVVSSLVMVATMLRLSLSEEWLSAMALVDWILGSLTVKIALAGV